MKREIKSSVTLALPLMAAFLAQKGMQFVDTFMMGWLGPDALAAAAIGTSIFIIILVFSMGTLSSIGIFIARAKGANNTDAIQINLQHGLCLAFFLSLPCMLVIWLMPYALTHFGQNQQVVNNVILLLHGLVWGLPGYLLFLVLREFIAVFSLTRAVMIVALGSLPLTFFVNYVLIYGKYGFPALGIAGIGFGGAAIMWFMFLCLLLFCCKNTVLKEFFTFKLFKLDTKKIYDMLFIGIPSGALFVFDAGMFLTAAMMMGYFGVDALASYQIALQWAMIAYAVPFALSMATSLLIGQAAGSKDLSQVKRLAFLNIGLGLIFSATVAFVFVLFPETFVKIFLDKTELHYEVIKQQGVTFVIIAAIFLCFDALQAIANGALRGMKDTMLPMFICLGCYWVLGVGSAYYFAFHTTLGGIGIWVGLTLGLGSAGIILLIRLLSKLNQTRL